MEPETFHQGLRLKLPPTSSGLKPLEGLSFLLAEDNVTNQLVASQMLKALGGMVEIASDGAIALELLQKTDFDILLIDIEMPRVSGLDVIRTVRGDPGALAEKPIIALTAYAMEEHRTKILNVGADGLIAKPISSITQFGNDIRSIAANAIKTRTGESLDPEAAPAPAPKAQDVMAAERQGGGERAQIEEAIFDGLVQSMGAKGLPVVLKKAEDDIATAGRQIEMAAETGDMVLMRGASHVVISVAGSVGGIRLQRQAEALNRLAHIEERGAAAVLAKEVDKEIRGVLAFIKSKRTGGA